MAELRSDKLRGAGDKAHELAKLTEHPAWPVLKQVFEERKQAYIASQARRFAAGGEDAEALDQRRVDYRRGWLRGAEEILRAPDNAIAELERLRKEADDEPS